MSDWNQAQAVPAGYADANVDPGLRKFMLGVFSKMALGLVWSAVLAYAVGSYEPLTRAVFTPPLLYVVQWGPLVLLLGSNFFMRNPSPASSGIFYWTIVTLMGAGLGIWVALAVARVSATTIGGQELFVTFGGIAKAFFATAAAFGGLALVGYTTKRNLTGLNNVLIMASWGLAAIAALSLFVRSSALEIGLEITSLVLFCGLVATQTNMLRNTYYHFENDVRGQAVLTNLGALNLYIAFVAIFQNLLSMFSRR